MVKLVRKREVLRNAINVGGIHGRGFAQAAKAFGVFGLGQVTASGAEPQDLAGAGDFKAFCHGLFRFDAFGTSHKLFKRARILRARCREARENNK
jgi:hypothetical protein